MGKYYQLLKRIQDQQQPEDQSQGWPQDQTQDESESAFSKWHNPAQEFMHRTKVAAGSLMPAARLSHLPRSVMGARNLQAITERLAPLAAVDNSTRLVVAGCNAGDGTSTVAAALAIDLSQRLSLHTILLDAHLRRPALDQLFAGLAPSPVALLLDGSLQIRPTVWPQLDVATCCGIEGVLDPRRASADFELLCGRYQAAIIDLGVPRLDARMLPLARPADPILLVVRYGATERQHLETSVTALRLANRSVAGVVFNAKSELLGKTLGRFIHHE